MTDTSRVRRGSVLLQGIALAAALGVLAGCVKEPQSRETILRELDSGYTSSNGGGQGYLGNQLGAGVTTRVR